MQPPSNATQRAALEGFIAARFQRAYGARLTHFLPHLLGLRDGAGEWQAAVGYADAAAGPLFLEQYLDAPVEELLEQALAINPEGIDPNFFLGDYLYRKGDYAGARQALERALRAAPRPDRPLADEGRRLEIETLLKEIRARSG
jgi:tetratricopeptide (TPR) repeat protein